jgi:flagellar hook-length control protein FliK
LGLPRVDPGAGGDASASAKPAIGAGTAAPADVTREAVTAEAAAANAGLAATKAASAQRGSGAFGAKPMSAADATAAIKAATSGASSTDPTAAAASAAGADADISGFAQASAGAMSAIGSGVISSSNAEFAGAQDSPSSPTSAAAAPAAGAAAAAMAANGAPAAPAAAVARPTGATAASLGMNAQTVTALATAASDKHASGGGANFTLSGAPGDGTAAALQLNVSSASSADAAPTPDLKVAAGVESPEFGQGLAERVSWMVDNNLNGAKLQVNPAQLGPIEVRIAVQGGHAQVWLTSHSAVTRDALESSSPKLREMLGAQGFGQVSVDISQRSFQEHTAPSQPYEWTPSASRSAAAAIAPNAHAPRTSIGAVDAYA